MSPFIWQYISISLVQLSLCLIKHHSMKTHRGVEGCLHTFLISTLGEDEWLLSHFYGIRRWKGSLPEPGVEFRLFGSWRSHYTNLAALTFMIRHSAVSLRDLGFWLWSPCHFKSSWLLNRLYWQIVGDVSEHSSTFLCDRDNDGITFRREVGNWTQHPRTLDVYVYVARYLCTCSACCHFINWKWAV